eukprot:807665_1
MLNLNAIRRILTVDDGSGRNILQKYGWHLVFTFIAIYHLRENVLEPFLRKRASQKTYKDATRPGQVLTLKEKMEIAREEQQKKAQIESDAAKKRRAEQQQQQQPINTKKKTSTAAKSRKSTSKTTKKKDPNPYRSNSYNPMAPNASSSSLSSSGSSYRPPRRSTGGGG